MVMPGMQSPPQNPEGMRSPADKGLEFEDVYMQTKDGLRIHGWFITCGERSAEAPTILFCHENAGNIGLRIPNYRAIVDRLHANIFALDYRGYGHSEGTPTEDGLIEDALCSWQWLQAAGADGRLDGGQVFIFGRSLGGAVAVGLAEALQRQGDEAVPRGLILENTFVSINAVVDAVFPMLAIESLKKKFLRLSWETCERIRQLEMPLLFLCGMKDELIPPWHMQKLHASSTNSSLRRVAQFPDGTHNDTWEKGGEKYWVSQENFIRECFESTSPCNASGAARKDLL